MDPFRDAMYVKWESRNRWVVTDYHDNVLAHLTTNGARDLILSFGKDVPKPFASELVYLGNTPAMKRAKIKSKKIKPQAAWMVWQGDVHEHWAVHDAEGHLMHYIDRTLAAGKLKELNLDYDACRKLEKVDL